MQDRRVRGVNAAFERLQVVASLDDLGDVTAGFRHLGPGEFRQRRHLLGRPEVCPDDTAKFAGRISRQPHLVLELMLLRLVQLIDAGAGHVELPAVIDAAQAALLVAPEEERCASVGAELVEQPHAPAGVAERDQALAEQADADGGAVGLGQLTGEERGHPVPAHRGAHGGAGADAGEEVVVLV